MDQINNYTPPSEANFQIPANEETLKRETRNLAWASDVWYSIKKHWVIELQRLIRAQRALRHAQ